MKLFAGAALAAVLALAAPAFAGGYVVTPAGAGQIIDQAAIVAATVQPNNLTASGGVAANAAKVLTSPAAATVATVASPAGTASVTPAVMMGLNQTLTPLATGRIRIVASGDASSGVIGDGCQYQVSYGTGTAPSAGGALAGTQVGGVLKLVAATTAARNGFSHQWIVTGLTVGTAYWIDEAFNATTGSTCTAENVNLTVEEF